MTARLVGLLLLCSSLAFAEGRLRIDADVRGAEVSIDGTVAGKTPLATKLSAGSHRIVLSKAFHKPTTAEIEIVDGKLVSIKLALEAIGKKPGTGTKPPPATTSTLEIRSNVVSEVTMDGRLIGTTPVMMSVALGKHIVELKAVGYRTARQAIDAKPGPMSVDIELVKQ
ncbi:MAG TPA: PEGA domain-containing protein [Kofleriaceae bacterium]